MSQQKKNSPRNPHIYKRWFQTTQHFPTKSHNPYEASQCTLKVTTLKNDGAKPLWLDIWHLPPFHLPQTYSDTKP